MTWMETGGVDVVRAHEDLLEGAACEELERQLERAAREGRHVVVALAAGAKLSARALGVLAHAAGEAAHAGGALVVCAEDESQRWVLRVTGLAAALTVFASVPEAIAALQAHAA